MTNLIYLQARHDRSLAAMHAAVSVPARRAHAELAARYAAKIAESATNLPTALPPSA